MVLLDNSNVIQYHAKCKYLTCLMIKSFKTKIEEKIFQREFIKNFPTDLVRPTQRKLKMLHAAMCLKDLEVPPGNHLEPLKGDRLGQYSIRINDQWRICFKWENNDAYEVEITGYHN